MKRFLQLLCALFLVGMSTAWAALVNINTADASALADAIAGVGPARAQAIVEYRTEYGPFQSIEDLMLVKGIGPSILGHNRSLLTVSDEPSE